jgi:hypothetical protein
MLSEPPEESWDSAPQHLVVTAVCGMLGTRILAARRDSESMPNVTAYDAARFEY